MLEDLQCLKRGETCRIPVYDFATHARLTQTVELKARKIILLDGILLFTHPELTQEMDIKVFVVRVRWAASTFDQYSRLGDDSSKCSDVFFSMSTSDAHCYLDARFLRFVASRTPTPMSDSVVGCNATQKNEGDR